MLIIPRPKAFLSHIVEDITAGTVKAIQITIVRIASVASSFGVHFTTIYVSAITQIKANN